MIEKVYSNICSKISKQKKMYERYKEEIYEINVSSLKHISAFGAIVGLALVIFSLPAINVLHMLTAYILMTLFFTGMFIIALKSVSKYANGVLQCYYLLMVLVQVLTIYMGTIMEPDANAITFLIVMLLLPLMIIDYPQRIIFVNLGMSVTFIVIAALTKTNEHVLLLDISDAVVVFFLSSFFILRTTRQQLINFENVQSEKDELMEKNNLINAIPAGIAVFEVNGGKVNQIYTNDGFYRLFEDTRSERNERCKGNFMNSIHPDDRKKLLNIVKSVVKGKDYVTTTCRSLKGDGTYMWVRYCAAVEKRDGDYLRVFTTYTSMEEEMKSRFATQAKTEFISRMSHDIRTPLNAILGTVALAKDETDDPEAISNYLSTVDVSGHFLLDLINDILDLNKIESGKIELHPECCMVSDYVRNIEASIRPLTDKKHIDFQIHMNCGLKEIYVDTVRHHQIFFNLLSNAVKYTPEYGHIEYSTMMIDAPEGMIGIRNIVSDDGIGMSESFLQHIFEPFSRASDVVINQTEGSGLGLSIVKNIVDAMDGSIEVKSEPGKGTTFIVDLYMQSVSGKNSNKKSINYNDSDLAGKKVLLVEDNEINVCIAVKLLEKKGCIVTSVSNGLEAVKYMERSKENEVDIILMDIRMPVMNGIDATREIRQIDKEFIKNIPVYAMTADAFAEDIDKMTQVGMNGHIPKPINPDLLYSTIARL